MSSNIIDININMENRVNYILSSNIIDININMGNFDDVTDADAKILDFFLSNK